MSLADKLKAEKLEEITPLQEQSMKARMEYENTLLKESLEQLAILTEKSKTTWEQETKTLIRTTIEKVNQLQTSNEIVNQNLNNVSEKLTRTLEKDLGELIKNAKNDFVNVSNSFEAQISPVVREMISSQQSHQDNLKTSQNEFSSFIKRFKIYLLGSIALVVILEIIQTVLALKG